MKPCESWEKCGPRHLLTAPSTGPPELVGNQHFFGPLVRCPGILFGICLTVPIRAKVCIETGNFQNRCRTPPPPAQVPSTLVMRTQVQNQASKKGCPVTSSDPGFSSSLLEWTGQNASKIVFPKSINSMNSGNEVMAQVIESWLWNLALATIWVPLRACGKKRSPHRRWS